MSDALRQAREALGYVEFAQHVKGMGDCCPACVAEPNQHHPWCKLSKAIAAIDAALANPPQDARERTVALLERLGNWSFIEDRQAMGEIKALRRLVEMKTEAIRILTVIRGASPPPDTGVRGPDCDGTGYITGNCGGCPNCDEKEASE